jgi:branched-subunit amino acid aminotransferase/4-amino-4-deoxychorismate lyase
LLEGITRRTVFEPAKEMGVEARTANLKPQELIEAQEAFLSTPAGGIVPVTRVSARPTRVPWQPARRGSQYQLRIFAVIRPTASLPSVTDPLIRSAPV